MKDGIYYNPDEKVDKWVYEESELKKAFRERKEYKERINKTLELLEKCLKNYCRNQWEGDWLKLDNPKTGDFYSFEEVFEEIRDILKGDE